MSRCPAHTPRPALPDDLALPTGRTLVMGILNVTPDSFSDGGRWNDPGAALDRALTMIQEGADLIDVGGESTRPGSTRVDPQEEWDRIALVLPALVDAGIVVSVDTLHAQTARRAADMGVAIINDVSGGCWDPQMNKTLAECECAYVIQRYHGLPGTPDENCDHGPEVVARLVERLSAQVREALEAGVDEQRIVVDPGLGFSLTNEHCWQVLENLGAFDSLGYPVLIGASRKRFLAASPLPDRDEATVAVTAQVARHGVWAVRVHEVASNAHEVRTRGRGVDIG